MAVRSYNLAAANRTIPAGVYHLRIAGVQEKISGDNAKTPGLAYDNLKLVVQEGPHIGHIVWLMLHPNMPTTISALTDALGVDNKDESGRYTEDVSVNWADYIGNDFWAELKEVSGQFAKNEIVKYVEGPDDSPISDAPARRGRR